MPKSFAQTTQAPCPACGQPVDLEIWLIVDTAERADLADRIRAGSIHAAPCPHCGNVGDVDAPLLIHDPDRRRVFFSPAQQTTTCNSLTRTRIRIDSFRHARIPPPGPPVAEKER